jgi:uncharacterized membrane protein YfhO
MKALTKLNTKITAISQDDWRKANIDKSYKVDSTATIKLIYNKPNYLKYTSSNKNDGFAVFSEMYYKDGWNAYIDGNKSGYLKVDFALRGMSIPAGKHTIEFKFEPQVVKTGSIITLISSIGMLLLLVGGIYFERKNKV